MTQPDWDDYRYFLATAQTGSLSGAARELRTNQPTVGRRIAALEDVLGVRLFHRHARGMSLTEAGARMLQSVQTMDEAAMAASRAVTGEDSSLAGTVRISAPESVGGLFLAPRLGRLARRYPAIEVVLQLTSATVDLLRNEADIAVRLFRPTAADLVARRIGLIPFALYASPRYLTEAPSLAELSELAAHPQISQGDELAHTPEAIWQAEHAPGARSAMRSASAFARAGAAAAGLGIALLPRCVGDLWPGLQRVLPGEGPPPREAWLVVHKDLRYVARIRVVLDFLAEIFEETRADVPASLPTA
ncbi:LysR family transcriptional regulator [Plasticicumulans acidivorans]|uniref:DNA-binding transcriptional LysR family regulator n=1 Tax=Plasticicumulans acidivorans TaxID=886464 RepID=A0A317MQH4_9GAMM|nr:LysR family transcriptional regulator [Plasticicumulans acidivorans]PWV58714.1 DNA-binding transcriptional LysR family regulator [Plasticicumulans acidivorans]